MGFRNQFALGGQTQTGRPKELLIGGSPSCMELLVFQWVFRGSFEDCKISCFVFGPNHDSKFFFNDQWSWYFDEHHFSWGFRFPLHDSNIFIFRVFCFTPAGIFSGSTAWLGRMGRILAILWKLHLKMFPRRGGRATGHCGHVSLASLCFVRGQNGESDYSKPHVVDIFLWQSYATSTTLAACWWTLIQLTILLGEFSLT